MIEIYNLKNQIKNKKSLKILINDYYYKKQLKINIIDYIAL